MARPVQDRCKRDHPLSGDNLLVSGGSRFCRACRKDRAVVVDDPYIEEHRETTYLVMSYLPEGRVTLNLVKDLRKTFERWTRDWDDVFLPVAVFPTVREQFCAVSGYVKLPVLISAHEAHRLLGKAPVVDAAAGAVFKHVKRLGPVAALLLEEWAEAQHA